MSQAHVNNFLHPILNWTHTHTHTHKNGEYVCVYRVYFLAPFVFSFFFFCFFLFFALQNSPKWLSKGVCTINIFVFMYMCVRVRVCLCVQWQRVKPTILIVFSSSIAWIVPLLCCKLTVAIVRSGYTSSSHDAINIYKQPVLILTLTYWGSWTKPEE